MLENIKNSGHKVLLATSKPYKYAVEILEYFDLYKYFDFVGGATMDETRNKKADVINYVLKSCDIKCLSEVIMVGDREQDIIGAKLNGIDSIGVLFGYGNREELESAGSTYIANSVDDIFKYL